MTIRLLFATLLALATVAAPQAQTPKAVAPAGAETFTMMSGIRLLNVPYKGSTPAMTDVIAGHVDLMFTSMVTGAAQVRAGKLKAFGVTSAARQRRASPIQPIRPILIRGSDGRKLPGSCSDSVWFATIRERSTSDQ